MLTTQRVVERSLRTWGTRVAVVDGERRLTYAALAERSARLANILLSNSAGPFAPVATLLSNALEFAEVDIACARSGVTRVGLSDRLSPDECRYILEDSGAVVLVAAPELLERLEADLPEAIELVLLVGGALSNGARRTIEYEAALGDASPILRVDAVVADSPNYILYTSGTTGRPKGATHSHGARALSMLNMLSCELDLSPTSVLIHAGPVTHGSGSKMLAFFAAGGSNVLLPRFDAEGLAAAITAEGGTHTFLVPTMLQRLLEGGPDVVAAVSSLEQISFGGAPISTALFRRAIEAFGPNLTQVYGSCEAPHPVTLLRPSDYLADDCSDSVLMSAGRAAYGVDIKVVTDAGEEVSAEEVGELLIRAPHLMSGYWRNEEATREVIDSDGWYSAGDLAMLSAEGLVTFQDRKRDLIISGGLNVYPSEVERVIAEYPGVRDVAVIGAPDDEWGEAVVAYVVRSDDGITEADIIAWTRTRLAGYKKPRRVEFLERLPLGSSNKVLKAQLRDLHWGDRTRRVN
jgi:acyl-CoA synthetase (AMP-forming)/AMP-acid ligase II